jgi:hypothetical protein
MISYCSLALLDYFILGCPSSYSKVRFVCCPRLFSCSTRFALRLPWMKYITAEGQDLTLVTHAGHVLYQLAVAYSLLPTLSMYPGIPRSDVDFA